MCRYIPQEILNDDFSALDKANIFMLGASLYELASGAQLPTGARQCLPLADGVLPSGPACSCGRPAACDMMYCDWHMLLLAFFSTPLGALLLLRDGRWACRRQPVP